RPVAPHLRSAHDGGDAAVDQPDARVDEPRHALRPGVHGDGGAESHAGHRQRTARGEGGPCAGRRQHGEEGTPHAEGPPDAGAEGLDGLGLASVIRTGDAAAAPERTAAAQRLELRDQISTVAVRRPAFPSRTPRAWKGSGSRRASMESATYSASAGPCLKPWPEPPPRSHQSSRSGWRSKRKCVSDVRSYW